MASVLRAGAKKVHKFICSMCYHDYIQYSNVQTHHCTQILCTFTVLILRCGTIAELTHTKFVPSLYTHEEIQTNVAKTHGLSRSQQTYCSEKSLITCSVIDTFRNRQSNRTFGPLYLGNPLHCSSGTVFLLIYKVLYYLCAV